MIGGPVSASAAGAPEAKRNVNKAKEKRRNDEAQQRRRFEDALELHISQVETQEAVQSVKEHSSEDAESERHADRYKKEFRDLRPSASAASVIEKYQPTVSPPPGAVLPAAPEGSPADERETDERETDERETETGDDNDNPSNRSIDVTG